jgi:hypothetical protein
MMVNWPIVGDSASPVNNFVTGDFAGLINKPHKGDWYHQINISI